MLIFEDDEDQETKRIKHLATLGYTPEIDRETRNRIRLSLAAYTYEYLDQVIMTDGEFDKLCGEIDLSVNTRRPDLDIWFRKNFDSSTGQWIHNHPELGRIAEIATQMLKNKL
jgi:hypothetical protein